MMSFGLSKSVVVIFMRTKDGQLKEDKSVNHQDGPLTDGCTFRVGSRLPLNSYTIRHIPNSRCNK